MTVDMSGGQAFVQNSSEDHQYTKFYGSVNFEL